MDSEPKKLQIQPIAVPTLDAIRAAGKYSNNVRAVIDMNGALILYFFQFPADLADLPEAKERLSEVAAAPATGEPSTLELRLDPVAKIILPSSMIDAVVDLLVETREKIRRMGADASTH